MFCKFFVMSSARVGTTQYYKVSINIFQSFKIMSQTVLVGFRTRTTLRVPNAARFAPFPRT